MGERGREMPWAMDRCVLDLSDPEETLTEKGGKGSILDVKTLFAPNARRR